MTTDADGNYFPVGVPFGVPKFDCLSPVAEAVPWFQGYLKHLRLRSEATLDHSKVRVKTSTDFTGQLGISIWPWVVHGTQAFWSDEEGGHASIYIVPFKIPAEVVPSTVSEAVAVLRNFAVVPNVDFETICVEGHNMPLTEQGDLVSVWPQKKQGMQAFWCSGTNTIDVYPFVLPEDPGRAEVSIEEATIRFEAVVPEGTKFDSCESPPEDSRIWPVVPGPTNVYLTSAPTEDGNLQYTVYISGTP